MLFCFIIITTAVVCRDSMERDSNGWLSKLTFFLERRSKRRPIAVNVLTCGPGADLVTVAVEDSEVLGLLAQLLSDGPALLLLHETALHILIFNFLIFNI